MADRALPARSRASCRLWNIHRWVEKRPGRRDRWRAETINPSPPHTHPRGWSGWFQGWGSTRSVVGPARSGAGLAWQQCRPCGSAECHGCAPRMASRPRAWFCTRGALVRVSSQFSWPLGKASPARCEGGNHGLRSTASRCFGPSPAPESGGAWARKPGPLLLLVLLLLLPWQPSPLRGQQRSLPTGSGRPQPHCRCGPAAWGGQGKRQLLWKCALFQRGWEFKGERRRHVCSFKAAVCGRVFSKPKWH